VLYIKEFEVQSLAKAKIETIPQNLNFFEKIENAKQLFFWNLNQVSTTLIIFRPPLKVIPFLTIITKKLMQIVSLQANFQTQLVTQMKDPFYTC